MKKEEKHRKAHRKKSNEEKEKQIWRNVKM